MSDTPIFPEPSATNVYGPVTPSQLFERAFALLRENFKLFFGIVLVVVGVEVVVSVVLAGSGMWFQQSAGNTAPLARALVILPLTLLGAALIYIFTQIIHGALFSATQAKLAGVPITVGEACRLAADKAGKLVGIALLIALRIFGYLVLFYAAICIPAFLIAFVAEIASHGSLRPGHMPSGGLIIFFIIFILVFLALYLAALLWLVARYAIAIPAGMAENLSITDSIRRSIQLSLKSRGRLYAVFLFVIGASIMMAAVTVPVQIMVTRIALLHHTISPWAVSVVTLGISVITNLLSGLLIAWTGVATALCYFDLRVRKEGFGMASPATIEVPPANLPPASGFEPPDIETGPLPIA